MPNYGLGPTAKQHAAELRLSRLVGPARPARDQVDWSYKKYRPPRPHGRLTYPGEPVYGFATTSQGAPTDTHGRNIFVETFDFCRLRPRLKREKPPLCSHTTRPAPLPTASIPTAGGRRATEHEYRATVVGPGVTPDVIWEGPSPGPYDAALDEAANAEQRKLFAADERC